jgi:hypothetical protein
MEATVNITKEGRDYLRKHAIKVNPDAPKRHKNGHTYYLWKKDVEYDALPGVLKQLPPHMLRLVDWRLNGTYWIFICAEFA